MSESTGRVSDTAKTREVELALLIDPADLPRLHDVADLGAALYAPARPAVTTYFDTPDLALKQAGIAIRLRYSAGRVVQTVKTFGTGLAGLKDRLELNADLDLDRARDGPDPSRIADMTIRMLVQANLVRLRPLFVTQIDRRKGLHTAPCGSRIEIAVDQGDVIARDAACPVSEVELELKEGRPGAVFDLGARIARAAPVRVGALSKAERGYALAEGAIPGFTKAAPLVLDPNATAEAAFRTIARGCLDHLIANEPAVMETRLPEGVHQMRVALRRLRAGFTVFRRALGRPLVTPFADRAKAVAGALGAVRDLDVMRRDILDPALSALHAPDGGVELLEALERSRLRAWDGLVSDFAANGAVASLVMDLACMLESRPWRETGAARKRQDVGVGAFAGRVLDKRSASVRAYANSLEDLTVDERHELRIEIKKLRYAVEFFESLYAPEAVAVYLKHLTKLQNRFGALNDVATAERLVPVMAQAAHGPTARDAGTAIIAWHMERAERDWSRARERYGRWLDAEPFWRSAR